MIETNSLLILALLAGIILYWVESLRFREFIIKMCKKICKESELQLLDQTVSLGSISIRRSNNGWPYIHRIYQFEVSTNGADRLPGYVTLTGSMVTTVQIDGIDGMTTIYPHKQESVH
ncbi:MAG: hypothetical protein ACI9XC_002469 [Gammaproteobacteria bacterium]